MSAHATGTSPDFEAYDGRCKAMAALADQVLPDNKAALFDALTAAGVHTIVVEFDGSGDSGQMERPDAFGADNQSVPLPEAKIPFKIVTFDGPAIVSEQRDPRDVIEAMTFELLEQTHDGWENNDGAFGEFTFSVADRTITLDYNERYTDSTNHQHEF